MQVRYLAVVDDDPSLLAALRFAFEAEGFVVTSYQTGEAVLAAGAPAHPSCLIIDQRLPGLSGLETLAMLRARGNVSPAILITSNPSRWIVEQATAADVEIVEKPLIGDVLFSRVRAAFDLLAASHKH